MRSPGRYGESHAMGASVELDAGEDDHAAPACLVTSNAYILRLPRSTVRKNSSLRSIDRNAR